MTADEFTKIIRNGSDKLRVDNIVLNAGDQELHGNGTLRIADERLKLEVHLIEGETMPEAKAGIYTRKDAWRLTGTIEYDLRFWCDNVGPVGSGDYFNRWRTFGLNPIHLIAEGFDAMTTLERAAFYAKLEHPNETSVSDTDRAACSTTVTSPICFEALLFKYPLFDPFCGREIKGELDGWEFTLMKGNEDTDLKVSLTSKADYVSKGEETDRRVFEALMHAISFTHGTHAWPYRTEYWREGRKVDDKLTAARALTGTAHAPFNNSLAFHAITGAKEWDYVGVIRKATEFFRTDSTLSREICYALYLLREAGRGVHSEIASLALCALFENLISHIFKELDLEAKALQENPLLKSFDEAKSNLLSYIDGQLATPNDGFSRLCGIVKSATIFSSREKAQAVVAHFGLQWPGDMEILFGIWKQARNLRFHKGEYADRSEDELKQSIVTESRVAAGINMLLLKLFGYSGQMQASTFEGKYRQI